MSGKKKKGNTEKKPHIPFFSRPPNKLVGYVYKEFCDPTGQNGGQVRLAVYIDKNGKEQQADAQIIWQYGWSVGVTKKEYYGYEKLINNSLFFE